MFNHSVHFAQPAYLLFLLILPFIIVWYWFRNKKNKAELQISTTESFKQAGKTFKERFRHSLFVLRLLAIALLIIAIARPQSSSSRQDVSIEGIDIVLALDISGSMIAEDFRPNRIEAAKRVALDFIDGRPNDRIGLVIFSGVSFTQCPLTTDHTVLKNLFKNVKSGMIQDGTAIGNGLATAVSRLKDSRAISKVIILLTDGVNNMGEIDPLTAADISKLYGLRVYTIGVGTTGVAPYPVQTPFGIQYQNMQVEIDEALLQKISDETGGKYFRATDNRTLAKIYKEIDKMEKSKIDVTTFRKKKEEFLPLALLAALFLLFELVLRNTYFRSIP
jgi:Ca-activated chloride channel homolog